MFPQPERTCHDSAASGSVPRLRRPGPGRRVGCHDRRCRPGAVVAAERSRLLHPARAAIAEPLLDLLLDQDCEPRIPVLALIDTRLAIGETDGWHYDDLPEDGQAWRETLLRWMPTPCPCTAPVSPPSPATTRQRWFAPCSRCPYGARWNGKPAKQVWSLWTRYACTAFYSHPWAWNEIGFGGPAYPAGLSQPGYGFAGKLGGGRHRRDRTGFLRRSDRRRRQTSPGVVPGRPMSTKGRPLPVLLRPGPAAQ